MALEIVTYPHTSTQEVTQNSNDNSRKIDLDQPSTDKDSISAWDLLAKVQAFQAVNYLEKDQAT